MQRKPADKLLPVSQSVKNRAYSMTLLQRWKRVFTIEIEKCAKCGGKTRIIACIKAADVIEKILKHLGPGEASQERNRLPPVTLFDHPAQLHALRG